MTRTRFSTFTPLSRPICLILCYSLVMAFAFIPQLGGATTGAAFTITSGKGAKTTTSHQRDNNNGVGNGNGNSKRDGKEFTVTPPERTQGAPASGLPNLDELRRKQPTSPRAPAPIPSTRCTHKDAGCASRKQQEATESPTRLIAWGMNLPLIESPFAHNAQSVSDSPFQLFSSTPASLSVRFPRRRSPERTSHWLLREQ